MLHKLLCSININIHHTYLIILLFYIESCFKCFWQQTNRPTTQPGLHTSSSVQLSTEEVKWKLFDFKPEKKKTLRKPPPHFFITLQTAMILLSEKALSWFYGTIGVSLTARLHKRNWLCKVWDCKQYLRSSFTHAQRQGWILFVLTKGFHDITRALLCRRRVQVCLNLHHKLKIQRWSDMTVEQLWEHISLLKLNNC